MRTPREILLEQHGGGDPELDRIRRRTVDVIRRGELDGRVASSSSMSLPALVTHYWVRAFRPIWLGLVPVWVGILIFHATTPDSSLTNERRVMKPESSEIRERLIEQRRLLTELLEEDQKVVRRNEDERIEPQSRRWKRSKVRGVSV